MQTVRVIQLRSLQTGGGPYIFCDQILQRVALHRQLGIHPLELGVFGFNVAELLYIRRFQAAVLGLPYVVSRIGNTQLTADVLDLSPGLNLLQRRDDLTFGEFALAAPAVSLGLVCPETSENDWIEFTG